MYLFATSTQHQSDCFASSITLRHSMTIKCTTDVYMFTASRNLAYQRISILSETLFHRYGDTYAYFVNQKSYTCIHRQAPKEIRFHFNFLIQQQENLMKSKCSHTRTPVHSASTGMSSLQSSSFFKRSRRCSPTTFDRVESSLLLIALFGSRARAPPIQIRLSCRSMP